MANKLIFRSQPDEGIRLQLCEKRVGPGMSVRLMNLSLNPQDMRKVRVPEAYERLLHDVLSSNATLFLRDDELLEAWRWIDPVLHYWQESERRPEPLYVRQLGPGSGHLVAGPGWSLMGRKQLNKELTPCRIYVTPIR